VNRVGTATAVVGAGIAALRATIRVRALHPEREASLRERGIPAVHALWHGRLMLCTFSKVNTGLVTMASRSKDGEIISRWLLRHGIIPTRGSTRKGGLAALEEMAEYIRAGHPAALTVDGPKGPPRVVQPGILWLARQTGAWIVPFGSSASRPAFLKSWDRYLVPKPFSRCIVAYGEPFPVPAKGDDEATLLRIAKAVDDATLEADRAMGVSPPAPWAPVGKAGGGE
jgi:lysophospholipid acyltransferase (LPLAT)-like uncharacterized protein